MTTMVQPTETRPPNAPDYDPQEVPPKNDPYADSPDIRRDISDRMDRFLEKARNHRTQFEREWFQNLLFYAGHHWIIFDRTRGQYRQRQAPHWFPMPVTNKVFEKANDNIASLLMTEPAMSWEPRSEDAASIAAAEIADQINETIGQEVQRRPNNRELATWEVLTGNGYVESLYDRSEEHGTTLMQHEECQNCGYVAGPKDFRDAGDTCPMCGSTEIEAAFERTGSYCPECEKIGAGTDQGPEMAFQPCPVCATGAMLSQQLQPGLPSPPVTVSAAPPSFPESTGEPPQIPTMLPRLDRNTKVGEQVPRGKVREIIRSPFNIFFDHVGVKKFNEEGGLRAVIVAELMDDHEAKEKYGPDVAPGTPVAAQGSSLSMQYIETLTVLTSMIDPTLSPTASAGRGSPAGSTARVLREKMYELPTKRFPQGLEATRIQGGNGKVVEWGPLQSHRTGENGEPDINRPFIPIVHFGFILQPGRAYAKTSISDIMPLNQERNMTRSMMLLIERRMGNPTWLLPDNLMVRDPTGEPGELIRYTHLSTGQGRAPEPHKVPGTETPATMWRHIELLDEEIEKLSGSFDIAHGEAPKGVTAASALALLGERQQRSVSPQVEAWELAQEERVRQQMDIFREYGVDARLRVRKEGVSKWAFEEWKASDLGGNINVRVVPGSAMPKSRAAVRATVEAELRIPGLIDVTNPAVRRRVHELWGTTELTEPYNLDVKYAQQENELFMRRVRGEQGGQTMLFRPLIDNHQVHVTEHMNYAKGDEFVEMERRAGGPEPDVKSQAFLAEFYEHLRQHMDILNPPLPPPGPGAQPAPGGPTMPEGRPPGSGPVFNAGKSEPEGESRTVMEPAQPMPGA